VIKNIIIQGLLVSTLVLVIYAAPICKYYIGPEFIAAFGIAVGVFYGVMLRPMLIRFIPKKLRDGAAT
jgi:hypothetical protein